MKGHAILEAAHQVGRDGKGTDRIVGYFERLLIKWPYREPLGETASLAHKKAGAIVRA
jgi:hypothetical protein